MSTRMTLPALLLVGGLCPCAFAVEGPLFEYDFGAVADAGMVRNLAGAEFSGELRGTWAQTALPDEGAGSVLTLDGESGFVEVPGSAGLHIGEEGFTVAATVRFADSGTVEGAADSHDMLLFKNQEYLAPPEAGGCTSTSTTATAGRPRSPAASAGPTCGPMWRRWSSASTSRPRDEWATTSACTSTVSWWPAGRY